MQSYADAIAQTLSQFGCDRAFGVFGTNIHHIRKALHRPDIAVYDFRHESGAAFAAAEYSIQADKFAVVFVTSGSGITNAITGLRCARADGARIVFIAGLTSENADRTSRRLVQETFPMDVEGLTGTTVHSALSYCVIIRGELDVERLRQTLARIKRDPLGGVLGVFLTDARSKSLIPPLQQRPKFDLDLSPSLSKETLVVCQEIAERFKTKSCILWIGYGCRGASALVEQLAERYVLPVLATPRAKGIFPETHPLYQGTTGLGESFNPMRRTKGPKGVLLLGSKAAELSSMFIQGGWANTDFYCVSLETSEVKRNMPKGSVLIEAEISLFLKAVLDVKSTGHKTAYRSIPDAIIPPVPAASKGQIHPVTVMSLVQDVAINRSGCSIISDAGHLYWTAHYLKFPKHGLYRSNLDSSPMGHAVCGVGMGLADNHAVAIVSDAAMLMQSEVSTAVLYGSKAIWLVMSGSRYGSCDQGHRAWGDIPPPHCIPYTDFELLARAVGCEGCTVTEEKELRKALREALARDGPTVINVIVDPQPVEPSKA
ncbi:acetolactate synthase [Fusarium mundagurra]|uniref:Acetolactate synthase n=1 Tax=Fusarium mundagurra TaxID=1567541 RepID=A0A8H5XWJ6_9HYPO|nr:acetolactate synthase [Fusarium mundagurra]